MNEEKTLGIFQGNYSKRSRYSKFQEINFSSSYSTSSSFYLNKMLGKSFCHNGKPKNIWAWLKKHHNNNKNNCLSFFTDIDCGAQQFP